MEQMDSLVGLKLTIEELVGRNFYHYTHGVKDELQPLRLTLPDLGELEDSDDDEDEYNFDDDYEDEDNDEDEDEDEDEEEVDNGSLASELPASCWVKRYASLEDLGPDVYLIYALELDAEMVVVSELALFDEPAHRSFFMDLPVSSDRSYTEADMDFSPTEDLLTEERLAFMAHRYLKDGFTFEGQRLPQAVIDRGGNGGSNTNYTDAIQSAHRLAYTHLSIDTTPEGVIESLSYSSWASSGSGYADMFSRPRALGDIHIEAVDMLLYFLNQYSAEEYEHVLAQASLREDDDS